VKAKNYCTTALLEKCDFDSLCELFPIIRERFIAQILEYDDFWRYYIMSFLKQIPYLRKLKLMDLLMIIFSLKRVFFPAGKEIVKYGDVADYIFFLIDGEIELKFPD
jgi:hypothetical protein